MLFSIFNISSVDDVAIMSSPTPKSSAMGIFDIAYGYMMARARSLVELLVEANLLNSRDLAA